MTRTGPYRGKRAVDLALVSVAAVPAVLLGSVCGVLIKLEDGGDVFFRQERVGKDGVAFHCWKFRTMMMGDNPIYPDDDRITRTGKVLRRLSLDELPQLLNVLRGQMSIVGPRPTLGYQVERYTPEQRRRLEVRPGLTGLAQVRGRNALLWADRIAMDLNYLARQSPLFDLYVLALSIGAVLRQDVGGHPVDDPLAQIDG